MKDTKLKKIKTKIIKEEKKYLEKIEFFNLMKTFKESYDYSKEHNLNPPKIPEKLGKYLLIMAENVVKMKRFNGYSYKDEMIGDCLENALSYGIYSFDHIKYNNPHAYFSKIMIWACFRRIQLEEKQLYAKYKNMEMVNILDDLEIEEYNSLSDSDNYDLIYEKTKIFIERYESNLTKKKESAILKKSVNNLQD